MRNNILHREDAAGRPAENSVAHVLPSGCNRMELKLELGLVMFPRNR